MSYYKLQYSAIRYVVFVLLIFVFSCKSNNTIKPAPAFNAQNAYNHIITQVNFGPRHPQSAGHDSVVNWITTTLSKLNCKLHIQTGTVTLWDSSKITIKNITAQLYPDQKKRLLFFTHYDTRKYSDQETDSIKQVMPLIGANDGASGVAVLLEMARIISDKYPGIGVDLIFFDAEDQGPPKYLNNSNLNLWCLGSHYWSDNMPDKNYRPIQGIGVDMVAEKNTVFYMEDHSRHFSTNYLNKIWDLANSLNYGQYFSYEFASPVFNDHAIISQKAKIRSLLIIGYQNPKKFTQNWHTQNDNLGIIDTNTIKACGQTLIHLVYSYN